MNQMFKKKIVFVFRMRYECKKHSKNKYILTLTIKEQINQIFSEEKKIKEIFFGNSEIFVNLEHSIYNAGDNYHWYIYLIFRFKHMKFMSSEKIFRFFFDWFAPFRSQAWRTLVFTDVTHLMRTETVMQILTLILKVRNQQQ